MQSASCCKWVSLRRVHCEEGLVAAAVNATRSLLEGYAVHVDSKLVGSRCKCIACKDIFCKGSGSSYQCRVKRTYLAHSFEADKPEYPVGDWLGSTLRKTLAQLELELREETHDDREVLVVGGG